MLPDVTSLFNYDTPQVGGPKTPQEISDFYGAPIASGTIFPASPKQGDMYIRTDFAPNRLFIFRGTRWERLYDNVFPSSKDVVTNSVNAGPFINNTKTSFDQSGTTYEQRQAISKVIVKPGTDY